MTPPIIQPADEYHRRPEVSKHDLDLFSVSPYAYIAFKERPPEQTDAMRLGSAIHQAILEPGTLEEFFAVAPQIDRRTKQGKEDWLAFMQSCGEKTILDADDYELVSRCYNAVYDHAEAHRLLRVRGFTEGVLTWTDELTGIACRARPDRITDAFIIDIKSCNDASENAFRRDCQKYAYHRQAAYYQTGAIRHGFTDKDLPFFFVCVEKKYPFHVAVYRASESMLHIGRMENTKLLKEFQNCRAEDYFPGLNNDEIVEIDMPDWYNQVEETEINYE